MSLKFKVVCLLHRLIVAALNFLIKNEQDLDVRYSIANVNGAVTIALGLIEQKEIAQKEKRASAKALSSLKKSVSYDSDYPT